MGHEITGDEFLKDIVRQITERLNKLQKDEGNYYEPIELEKKLLKNQKKAMKTMVEKQETIQIKGLDIELQASLENLAECIARQYDNAPWILADPDTCARLEKLKKFKIFEGADVQTENIGVVRFGTLAQKCEVYKNPWFTANTILVGYKETPWPETGCVYMERVTERQ